MINNHWYCKRLKSQGVKYGDEIVFSPFGAKKTKIKLNRKTYRFTTSDCSEFWSYQLKVFQNLKIDILLSLHQINRTDEVYCLQSLNGEPFKINGNLSTHAFVEKGDQIEFGLNLISTKITQTILENALDLNTKGLPVLILGETGSGKSFLAKSIHETNQKRGPFVHINLSSFSRGLVESELFGHIKGAFTGALQDKPGAIKEAQDGTLFLDEIDSLSEELQIKLLLFLDSMEYRAVGSSRVSKSNAQIIFASGRPLENLVLEGRIRKDFYFRIQAAHKVQLKPLRNDKKQVEIFCEKFANEKGLFISNELVQFYKRLPWPGNIRQLKSHLLIKEALSKSTKIEKGPEDLELLEMDNIFNITSTQTIEDFDTVKTKYFQYVFESVQGNIKLGAKLLKISPTTFRESIKKISA